MPLIDGGTQRLPRIVGLGRALDLILTGRIIDSKEALAMGLVTEVVPEGGHLERALEIADGLAGFPQDTMLADRRAALEGLALSLEEGFALEARNGRPTLETACARGARLASPSLARDGVRRRRQASPVPREGAPWLSPPPLAWPPTRNVRQSRWIQADLA